MIDWPITAQLNAKIDPNDTRFIDLNYDKKMFGLSQINQLEMQLLFITDITNGMAILGNGRDQTKLGNLLIILLSII